MLLNDDMIPFSLSNNRDRRSSFAVGFVPFWQHGKLRRAGDVFWMF